MRILFLLRRRLKNASTFSNSSLKANPIFPERGGTEGFCEAKFDFLASAKFTKNRTLLVPT